MLHHALKVYKLVPELHWTAGGYIWPVDRIVECSGDLARSPLNGPYRSPISTHTSMLLSPMMGTPLGSSNTLTPMPIPDLGEGVKLMVESSGAIPLVDEDITVINSPGGPSGLGHVFKEKVPFTYGGELDKLIVNVLMVAFVP